MAEDKIGENPHLTVIFGINRTRTSFHSVTYFFSTRHQPVLQQNSFFPFKTLFASRRWVIIYIRCPQMIPISLSFLPPLSPSFCLPGVQDCRTSNIAPRCAHPSASPLWTYQNNEGTSSWEFDVVGIVHLIRHKPAVRVLSHNNISPLRGRALSVEGTDGRG